MRKILIWLLGAGCLFALHSCKKDSANNPLSDVNNLAVGSYITFVEKTSTTFNVADLANAAISFSVDKVGSDVDRINMYAVQGANSDTTAWKFIKTVAFTGPGTVLSATAPETAAALGIQLSDFVPGGNFTFYQRIFTKDGRQFDISNINPSFEGSSNYNMALRFTSYVGCPFVAPFGGNFVVVEDGWEDWVPGDIVVVEDGPGPNQINLQKVYPNPAYGDLVNPIIVDIDPASGIATVPEVQYGDYGVLISCVGSGFVFACTGTIDLSLDHFQAAGDYGFLRLLLQKQ